MIALSLSIVELGNASLWPSGTLTWLEVIGWLHMRGTLPTLGFKGSPSFMGRVASHLFGDRLDCSNPSMLHLEGMCFSRYQPPLFYFFSFLFIFKIDPKWYLNKPFLQSYFMDYFYLQQLSFAFVTLFIAYIKLSSSPNQEGLIKRMYNIMLNLRQINCD